MSEEHILNEITLVLKKKGYSKVKKHPILSKIRWSFDLVAEMKGEIYAFEYRKNDNILEIFYERMISVKKYPKRLRIFLIFSKPPRRTIQVKLEKIGIGIIIFKDKKLYQFSDSKDFSSDKLKKKKKKVKKQKQMEHILVFVSSKQNEMSGGKILSERNAMSKIILTLNNRHNIPIHPCLIEYDKTGATQFKRKITKHMKKCSMFVCALTEEYGEFVEYEIKKAFELIPDTKAMLIMQKVMKLDEINENQATLIDFIYEKKNFITLPYSSNIQFKDLVHANLIKMVSNHYAKKRIKSPFDF